jgi:hypothetical protein
MSTRANTVERSLIPPGDCYDDEEANDADTSANTTTITHGYKQLSPPTTWAAASTPQDKEAAPAVETMPLAMMTPKGANTAAAKFGPEPEPRSTPRSKGHSARVLEPPKTDAKAKTTSQYQEVPMTKPRSGTAGRLLQFWSPWTRGVMSEDESSRISEEEPPEPRPAHDSTISAMTTPVRRARARLASRAM